MSRTPPTRRDYERTIKAIVQSRQEVQKLIDAARSDEHFSGALVSVSVPREDNVSVAWETFHTPATPTTGVPRTYDRNERAKELRWRGYTLRMNA